MKIKLSQFEDIVAVVPEVCSGPGWINHVVWIHIVDSATGKYRLDCLQPDQITEKMWVMFDTLCAAHSTMKSLVGKLVERKLDG